MSRRKTTARTRVPARGAACSAVVLRRQIFFYSRLLDAPAQDRSRLQMPRSHRAQGSVGVVEMARGQKIRTINEKMQIDGARAERGKAVDMPIGSP